MHFFLLLILFSICMISSCFILSKISFNVNKFDSLTRGSPIDGLRGILALSVLVLHFYATYHWKVTGVWEAPNVNFISNFGAISVSYFFLITGYLFLGKVLNKDINWKKLYLSRLKRIVPLYYFVTIIILFFTLVFIKESYTYLDLTKWIFKWIFFKGGDLNHFETSQIIAGVNWTLTYEWAFYFSLPLICLFFGKKAPQKHILVISFVFLLFMVYKTNIITYILFPLAYPALFFQSKIRKIYIKYKYLTSYMLVALFLYSIFFTAGYSIQQMTILAFIFAFIVNGFDFFGILNNKGLKILGDISYSVYLIHGLILYLLFTILNIFDFSLRIEIYYLYFPFVFTLVVLSSFSTYLFVEVPFLNKK